MLVKPKIIANMLVRNIDAAPNQSRTGCGANQCGLASYPLVVKSATSPARQPRFINAFRNGDAKSERISTERTLQLPESGLNIGTSGFEVLLKGFRRNAVPPIVAARRSNSSAAVTRTPLNRPPRGSATNLPRAHLHFFFNDAQKRVVVEL
jgi:hypothetical protein